MAEKKSITVIKKITISGGGHHGGAWKVAFADFMTAMMAFFLCMWLLSISPEARQSISDYFSTPSVIEYQFRNFGVEMTLEKLFTDLLNEPFDTVSKLLEPMDKTPNIFEFGDETMALSYIMENIGKEADNVEVNSNFIRFSIPDNLLFRSGTSELSTQFVSIMQKIKKVVSGLDESQINITSQLFIESIPEGDTKKAELVAQSRLDYMELKVKGSLEHETTNVTGVIDVAPRPKELSPSATTGFLKFEIIRKKEKKPSSPNKKKGRPDDSSMNRDEKKRDLYDELSESFRKEVRKK